MKLPKPVESLNKGFEKINEQFSQIESKNNFERRVLHAECELLILDIDALLDDPAEECVKTLEELKLSLSVIASQIKLIFSRRKVSVLANLILTLDEIIRTFALYSFLALSSILLALPCVFVRPVDVFLVKFGLINSKFQISNMCKCFIGNTIIKLSGISLITEGQHTATFGKVCSLVCFSHASTMDAFILSAVVPVRHYSLVSETFSELIFLC